MRTKRDGINRREAVPLVRYVVDDAGSGRVLHTDMHAIVREGGDDSLPSRERKGHKYPSVLVGWHLGFDLIFVAVHSYLDVIVTDEEATEMATYYLQEIGVLSNEPNKPDYIIR